MPPAPALPSGVSVELQQLRGDIAVDRVQVQVANGSDRGVTIAAASLRSAAFAEPAAWSDDPVTLAPGRRVNLPVELPAARCGDDGAVHLSLDLDDGSGRRTIDTPLADPLEVAARLSERQCTVDAVEAVAAIEAVEVVPRDDGTAVVRVTVDPVADAAGAVRLVGVRGTPLLRFPGTEEWPLAVDVAGGDPPRVLDVPVQPRRCDPHAIAEDKVGTLLTLVVQVEGEERTLPLPRAAHLGDALLAFAASACGLT